MKSKEIIYNTTSQHIMFNILESETLSFSSILVSYCIAPGEGIDYKTYELAAKKLAELVEITKNT